MYMSAHPSPLTVILSSFFNGPVADVVPDQFQVGLVAGANELKITVSGLGCALQTLHGAIMKPLTYSYMWEILATGMN